MLENQCVFCEGLAKKEFEDMNLFDGKITLKGQPYFKCTKCGKDFVTTEQMSQLEQELKKDKTLNSDLS